MKFSEKLKLIRTTNRFTQAEFAKSLGVSRGNLSGLELGNVKPTALFINCVSLMYNIDKNWLTDEENNDLGALNGSNRLVYQIMEQYEELSDPYKKFVENQIKELLEIQNTNKSG